MTTLSKKTTKYKVLAEYIKYIAYGKEGEKRVEQGDIIDDISSRSATLLVKSGALEVVQDTKKEVNNVIHPRV